MSLIIFTRTTDYRHASIEHGVNALLAHAAQRGLPARATEDARQFSPGGLAGARAVVWLSTSGEVLDGEQRAAFESFVRAGGGYVGVHSASATELSWPFYGALVGARFTGHPDLQPARLTVEDREHPATAHLPSIWERSDEWYEFDVNPRPSVRVLISVDEASYQGGRMGDHPLSWCQELGPSRSFYTALGHRAEDFDDPLFAQHVAGGIDWVLGLER